MQDSWQQPWDLFPQLAASFYVPLGLLLENGWLRVPAWIGGTSLVIAASWKDGPTGALCTWNETLLGSQADANETFALYMID